MGFVMVAKALCCVWLNNPCEAVACQKKSLFSVGFVRKFPKRICLHDIGFVHAHSEMIDISEQGEYEQDGIS
jgi:hypothetical protein